jgi:hypothetical protein
MRKIAAILAPACLAGALVLGTAHAATLASCYGNNPYAYIDSYNPGMSKVYLNRYCSDYLSVTGTKPVTISLRGNSDYVGRLQGTITPTTYGCPGGAFDAVLADHQGMFAATSPSMTIGKASTTCTYTFSVNPTGGLGDFAGTVNG